MYDPFVQSAQMAQAAVGMAGVAAGMAGGMAAGMAGGMGMGMQAPGMQF